MKNLWLVVLLLTAISFCQSRIDPSSQLAVRVLNDGTTGTTVNQLAKANTASGNAINASTTDTSIPVFVVVGGAGTTGAAQLATAGVVTCKFDAGGGTTGHYVQASTSTAGTCHDATATAPTSGWVVGLLLTSPAANANGSVLLYNYPAGGGGGGSFTGGTLTSELTLAASTTGAASENTPSGTAPTTPVAGDFWRDANGFNFIESTTTNGSMVLRSDQAGSIGGANQVVYTADANVAKYSENGGALQEVMGRTKTQTAQNKTLDSTDVVPRVALGTDALGWENVCDSGATVSAVASITCTPVAGHVHNFYHFYFYTPGYTGNGIATIQGGNSSTADTGANYSYALLETATNSTSTGNSGCRVGSAAVTSARHVVGEFNNVANGKAKDIEFAANNLSESSATAPTRDTGACIWANTAGGIGTIQVIAYNATTGTTTTTFLVGARLIVWGRD